MESLTINDRIYKINFIPFEDKCGLNEDGTYDNIYRGNRIELRCDDEILRARTYEDTRNEISFFLCPYTIFGNDLVNVKKYFQEKYGIRVFKYFDPDNDDASYVRF